MKAKVHDSLLWASYYSLEIESSVLKHNIGRLSEFHMWYVYRNREIYLTIIQIWNYTDINFADIISVIIFAAWIRGGLKISSI